VRPETSAITILAMMRYGQRHRGYDIVLAVLEQVARRFPDVRLILFGTDDLSEADIPFSFENAGRLEPDDLPALYSRADIFLELSRHHGFGRTGIEAMACGAACVLSDSGGVRDYARHGENALIVPVTDVTAATEAAKGTVTIAVELPFQGSEKAASDPILNGIRLAVKDGRRQGRSIGRAVAEALAPVR
jgi:glycosyltransferase involved in cell wall biosynthesis